MSFGRAVKRQMRGVIAPGIFLTLVAYFAWSATQGAHGLEASAQRKLMLQTAQADLAKTQTKRDAWERRVAGLRTSHLDPDALDERARAMLNMSDPSDIVVPYGPKNRLY